MKVYLYLNDKLLDFTLPQVISGSFSFDESNDEESKLINIEAKNNQWILYSTDDVSILDNGNFVKEKIIIPNNFYFLTRNKKNYLIYICGLFDNKLSLYKYNNLNLVIGNSQNCNIHYALGNSNNYYSKIFFNKNYIIERNDVSIYINNIAMKNNQELLKFGDVIDIYSLKIILLNGMILINNPNNENNMILNNSELNLVEISNEIGQNIEIKDKNLYSKDNYFSKSPYIRRIIDEKNIKLSAPPRTDKGEELPFILTVGPILTMAIISFVTIGSSISKIISHETKIEQQIPSLISASAMLLSMLMWPLIMKHYNKKHKEKKRKELIEKYDKYLNSKRQELEVEYKLQKEILIENLITPEECLNIINKKGYKFWDKRVDQEDFLLVRIGVGDCLFKVKIEYPEDGFTIEDDELKKQADKLVEDYKYIKNVPMGYSFLENIVTAVMGNINKGYNFIDNIIIQMVTFYNYEDLKIVLFTNDVNEKHWNYIKYLNHNFNNERSFRFFATTIENTKYVADYLDNEVKFRMNNKLEFHKPHYLIIIDDYDKVKSQDFIKKITECDDNIGFSCIILENKLSKLPSKCNNFITLGFDNRGGILKNSFQKQERLYFKDEVNDSIDMMNVSKMIANIPIEFEDGLSALPDVISFLEMEKIGKVEQLNVLNRWNMNDSTTSLKAEVGVDDKENIMYLDLHERAHGPHGLIAGTTGSGKSEFIITYILSMCVNYSPYDVSFVLIDYKGGGLALAFENKVTGMTLPHLAGTITNLDKAELDRTLVSIDSEVKRRQKMFNEARDKLGESTIDIYKYQKFYHEGRLNDPIPHLFIVCDEFAELKSQQPDFMENLISVARIGRSLGVHLILATQKPSGVVNDQIWSNSRFKICLKVQDEADSREMLKKNDAAYIKQVGRFYLQVGYDEYYALGQSGWCGSKYFPSDKIIKNVDRSLNIINECGLFIKSIQASSGDKKIAKGDQLGAILKEIIISSQKSKKISNRLWLENIPEIIIIDELCKKYNLIFTNDNIEAIIGEYDAPEKQEQGIVKYNYLNDGNTIIYGNDGSERELLLNSIIYSTVNYYSSEYINFYVIDYGSEFFNRYMDLSHFGGVVTSSEDEEFNNLFKLIKREIKKRKKLLANAGVDFNSFKRNYKIPLMVIILNNYDSIYENNQNLYDELPELVRDSERYGIVYIFTCNNINSVQNKISSNFHNYYSFKMKDSSDYSSVFGISTKVILRKNFGRGLLSNDGIHEFQTSKIIRDDDRLNDFLTKVISKLNQLNRYKAKKIPLLPNIVRFKDVNLAPYNLNDIPVGISKNDLEIVKFDFTNNVGNIISSNRINNTVKFIRSLSYVLININSINLFILDPMKLLNLNNKHFSNYYISKIDEVIDRIIDYIKKLFATKSEATGIIIIFGLNKFVNSIKKEKLEELSKIIKSYEKISLIIVDDSNKIKNYVFDSWFSSIVNLNDGIWIGKGIVDQNLFHLSTINKNMTIELKNDKGYYISEGSVTLCKFIDFFTKDDENGK